MRKRYSLSLLLFIIFERFSQSNKKKKDSKKTKKDKIIIVLQIASLSNQKIIIPNQKPFEIMT